MKGRLYIVATPIGNLKDITLRAIEVLNEVDIIACEDTRVAKKLLNHLGIKNKSLISYYEQVEDKVSEKLIKKLKEGKNIALISDAGTPTVSDPGYRLIKKAIDSNIDIISIPGAFAGVVALTVSGLPTDKFIFLGFLPPKDKHKIEILKKYGALNTTLIIYESPHKLIKTLKFLENILGNCEIVLAKELTKIHETILRGRISDILDKLEKKPELKKGEFVILCKPDLKEDISLNKTEIKNLIEMLRKQGKKTKEIAKIISDKYNLKKNDVYKFIIGK